MILSANDLSNQAEDMVAALQQKQQPLYDLLNSIQAFLQDGTLKGEGYASAKDYFEGHYLPVIRGMILVHESFQENTANCLSQLAQLDDSGLVMDTEALQEDIRSLRREWMRLFELSQGLGIFLNQMYRYRIEESIREIEKKIREVYAFDTAMQGVYNGTEDCLDAVAQGLSQISRGCYDVKGNRFVPPKDNMQWAKALNKEWAARSIDFKGLHSKYWNRTDGYFCENWWQDPEKLKEAAEMLKEEARLLGGIDLPLLNGQYRADEKNHRIYAVQALANVLRTGSYDVETVYHLEVNYLTADMDYTRANDVLSVKGIELLQKRQKEILLKEAGDWVERTGLVGTVRGLAQLSIMTSNYFAANSIKLAKKSPKIKDTKVKGAGEAEPLENSPYVKDGKPNGRPQLSGEKKLQFEKDVYNNNVDLDGVLRDPNTGDVIDWKPGQPRKGVVDFGHKAGNSYNDMFQKYKNGDITLDQLKEFQFDPNNYRLETPWANRSHKFE